jgi:hypothetical protein
VDDQTGGEILAELADLARLLAPAAALAAGGTSPDIAHYAQALAAALEVHRAAQAGMRRATSVAHARPGVGSAAGPGPARLPGSADHRAPETTPPGPQRPAGPRHQRVDGGPEAAVEVGGTVTTQALLASLGATVGLARVLGRSRRDQ